MCFMIYNRREPSRKCTVIWRAYLCGSTVGFGGLKAEWRFGMELSFESTDTRQEMFENVVNLS